MSEVYNDWPNLNGLSISDRIKAIKETVMKMIEKGQSIEDLKEVADSYVDDEMYEAAEAVLSAIEESKTIK